LFGLAQAQLAQGQLDKARATTRRAGQPTDRLLFLGAKSFFLAGEFDSCRQVVAQLVSSFPSGLVANDALELAVASGTGERAGELARAMLDYETGADEAGLGRARALSQGDDAAAEQACLLAARFLRRLGKPKDALALLDEGAGRLGRGYLPPRALLEQALVYREDLGDENRYRETLERLIVECPGSPLVPLARDRLASQGRAFDSGPAH
jgi:hypothetical protein